MSFYFGYKQYIGDEDLPQWVRDMGFWDIGTKVKASSFCAWRQSESQDR